MKNYLSAAVLFFSYVQLAVGVPLLDQLFAHNAENTTKHWVKEPRVNTSKHWELNPRVQTIDHWEIPDIQPRDQDKESMRNSELLLTDDPFEGGNGTLPPGAVNDGNDKDIIMVPYEPVPDSIRNSELLLTDDPFEGGNGTVPPGAVNDGNDKEIIMVPYVDPEGPWVGGQGTPPPGAQNDGSSGAFMRGARFLLRAFGL